MPRLGTPRVRTEAIRKATLSMSVATYTPVSYWLSIPLIELTDWMGDVLEMQKSAKSSR